MSRCFKFWFFFHTLKNQDLMLRVSMLPILILFIILSQDANNKTRYQSFIQQTRRTLRRWAAIPKWASFCPIRILGLRPKKNNYLYRFILFLLFSFFNIIYKTHKTHCIILLYCSTVLDKWLLYYPKLLLLPFLYLIDPYQPGIIFEHVAS